jgi:hypothetical protein
MPRAESVIGRMYSCADVENAVANIGRKGYDAGMDEGRDEGRKRVLAIVAGIIVARNLERADDLFGGPQGSPRTERMIAAAVQWGRQDHAEDR